MRDQNLRSHCASGTAGIRHGPAGDARDRARAYHRWQLVLTAAGLALSVLYFSAWLATGAAVASRNWLDALTPIWWLQLALAMLALGAGYRLLSLPLAWLGGFWLPRRFGLLHQSFARWLWDAAKAAAIAAVLGVLAA